MTSSKILCLQVLLLNDNWLRHLHEAGDGKLSDLNTIRVRNIFNSYALVCPLL